MNYLSEVVRTIEKKLPKTFDILQEGSTIAVKADGLRTSDSLYIFGGVNWFSARVNNSGGKRVASSMGADPDEEVDKIVKWLLDSYKERK